MGQHLDAVHAGKTVCKRSRARRSALAAAIGHVPLNGVQLIAAERTRQIADEGYDATHDDGYTEHQLLHAASSYVDVVAHPDEWAMENGTLADPTSDWPWDKEWWKPSPDPVRNLVKAGALIAAEIDRLQRLAAKGGAS